MRAFTVTLEDILACPKHSLAVEHYRTNGGCRCAVDARLTSLARAVYGGTSNEVLIRMAGRLADLLQDDYPAHAQRLRVAFTRRGESLATRAKRIEEIRRTLAISVAFQHQTDPEPQTAVGTSNQGEGSITDGT